MTPSAKKKILIIEDDQFLKRIYDIKLKKEGFEVKLASDGDEGIEKLKEGWKPELILLDLIMPKKNGFEVLEEIKMDNGLADIPVVILSNLGQEADIKRGIELGAVDFLVKTEFSIDAVVNKVKEYLAKAALKKSKG